MLGRVKTRPTLRQNQKDYHRGLADFMSNIEANNGVQNRDGAQI
jgi:hypothetical protein